MNFNFQIYRIILVPILRFVLQTLKPFFPSKIREIIELKKQNIEFNFSQKPFWLHAASGEIEYAKPVLRELKKTYPEIPILVTYSSVSAINIVKAIPEVDQSCMIPWDTPEDLYKFVKNAQPRALLIARTDVWPEMMRICSLFKIPSILFSATLTANSRRVRGFTRKLSQFSFKQLNQIFCVSEEDQKVFLNLDPSLPVKIAGDTRFEQVLYRLKNPKPLKSQLKPNSFNKILVAGSTWPEDDAVLLEVLSKNPEIKCIWAPHELESLTHLEEQLSKHKITYNRYLLSESWNNSQVLLVDEVGILADLYSWGQVAFVGGSFREKVHSVMEPLASAKPVLVGPHFTNNREAVDFLQIPFQVKNSSTTTRPPLNLVARVLNAKQFEQALNERFSLDESSVQDLANLISREVKKRTGATPLVLDWVKKNSSVQN